MSSSPTSSKNSEVSEAEDHILQSVRNLRFGTVQVFIHDARVVQIQTNEKTRFDVRGKPLG